MWLADTSIKRPVFATMFILALVILGLVSYPEIGVDLFPKIEFPIVNITTRLNGASPEIMDIDVTDKIEESVNTINGVKTITSTSAEGVSTISIEFVLERDIDMAVQDVREKVSLIRSKLPTDILEPIIQKVDPDANPVYYIALTGRKTIRDLSTYADEVLKDQLQRINGVGALRFIGLRLRQVRIWLDADKLRAFQVTPNDVMTALSRENVEIPGGRIEAATKEYTVKVKGEFPSVQEFNDLIVSWYRGVPVRIRDVGRAEDGMEEQRSIVRFNGLPAVAVGIQKQSGTNTVEVIDRVKTEIEKIRKTLPPGMVIHAAFDQSTFINRSIREVQNHLIIGGILAVIAVFLFLRNVRTTLISAVALPISVIATFTLIRAFDFTFNNMTMLALSLSVGILIDDAIIVIENIHRNIEIGMDPREAASFATSEIGLAVMATTLAIVAIFLPVAFMKGIIGRFFMSFALTVVFAVMVSLLVSFTLTPMLAAYFLRRRQHGNDEEAQKSGQGRIRLKIRRAGDFLEAYYRKTETWYRKLLVLGLRYRLSVLTGALIIFVLSMYMTKFMGKEFVPPEDQSNFIIRLEAPIDYSVAESDRLFQQAEEIVRNTPEVVRVMYAQGLGTAGTGQVNKGRMTVGLKKKSERKRSQEEIKAELRRRINQIPGLKGTAEDISLIGGGVRNVPIQYVVRGTDLSYLTDYMKQIVARFAKLPGVVDVDTSLEAGKPELRVTIDRDKAADLGVSVADIAAAINVLISGEVDVTKFKDEAKGRRYDVRVRLNPQDRMNPGDIGKIYIRARDGRLVELANVVQIREGGAPSTIYRVDRQRAMIMYASLEKKPLGQAMDELNAIAAGILPLDYSAKYKGAADTMKESFGFLIFALLLGVLMAYMVLAAQFESFLQPVIVLLSMPLSFIGAFGALVLTGKTISIFSMIGLILLMGLVKKNAILLVDYTNTLRERGMSRREAILEAGPVRLRPILMTTFAMIFGMLPVAAGLGDGAETRSPMGVAVIGGLITSLFLTLVVVPAAYDLFDEWQEKIKSRRRKKP
ncbi:MAG TPA: efflux RND transporter permease subunit [Syntrophales bacterium]|nr:efflux RND transporter permease subunit [Syntrophales bacterium]HQG33828.1 efflux RND transporter permease subunit [Syntrophales bacterium]HQI35126.1 efflux RND transporter permease subunit [Syntrophales bacterium]